MFTNSERLKFGGNVEFRGKSRNELEEEVGNEYEVKN